MKIRGLPMRKCFRNDEKCARFHLNHGQKNFILMVVLFVFIVSSVVLLLPGRGTDHDSGRTSSELTVQETTEENVVTTNYVDAEGNLTCAIDKHYTTIVKTLDEEGRIIEERYLDEQEKPTGYYGYYGISYVYKENTVKITYLDKDEKPVETQGGYAIVLRSFNEKGQTVDDDYYDEEMNPVMCTGGYYGIHRIYNEQGQNSESIYLGMNGLPVCNSSGYAMEKCSFDKENRVDKRFYFDEKGKVTTGSVGQFGEAYTYDENNRLQKILFLDKDGNPRAVPAGYIVSEWSYYRDGTLKTDMYFNELGKPVALSKGQYGVKYVDGVTLYLNRYGQEKLCVDNLLNGYPFMVVVVGCILCVLLCFLPKRMKIGILGIYVLFILYETLMFRENGDIRTNLKLFSYAGKFLTDFTTREGVINNVWLFIPFGTGLYALLKRKRVWVAAFFFSVVIELIQYFTGLGIAELDDVFGNTLGGAIGMMTGVVVLENRKRVST